MVEFILDIEDVKDLIRTISYVAKASVTYVLIKATEKDAKTECTK